MANVTCEQPGGRDDPHNLARFLRAQESAYDAALSEIHNGQKVSHWMWFIFPEFVGLGRTETSRHFAIRSLSEARAYLEHPILGQRLLQCANAVLGIHGRSAHEIFGSPDDLKLRSSATLFAIVSAQGSVFHQIIAQYFVGHPDETTLRLAGTERIS